MKKVSFGGKPTAGTGLPVSPDDWVHNREQSPREPNKRLTIDVSVKLHKRIKSQCAISNQVMADVIRDLLEEHFPETPSQIGHG